MVDSFDVFDHSGPRYATAGDGNYYIWDYQKLPRITWILSQSPGDQLLLWAAKMGCLRQAAWLVHGGLFKPPLDDPIFAELERYVDQEPMRMVSEEDAIRNACNWASNMKECVRYRDHKGRIGTAAHGVMEDIAKGLRKSKPDIEYLFGVVGERIQFPDDMLERYDALGKDVADITKDLAYHVLPHALNVWDHHEKYQPEYCHAEITGINLGVGYACTLDLDAWYSEKNWRKHNADKWPFGSESKVRAFCDLKTGSSVGEVKYQLSAAARCEFLVDMRTGEKDDVPDVGGIIGLHSIEGAGIKPIVWAGSEAIDRFADGVFDLCSFHRNREGLPRASRGRKPAPPKKGERPCPIDTGG